MTQYLLFNAGGLDLAAPAELVKTIHEQLSVQSVAGTCGWFRGLAVAHGKLLPVTDVGAFAGRRSSTGRTLELVAALGIAGLQVDNVMGLSQKPIKDEPLTDSEKESVRDSNLPLTNGVIVQDDRVHRLLDLAALVQSPAFLTIAETS